MLSIILYTIFILACVVLVIAVLLQPGKADAGALFTSSVSTTAFGPRGTQTVLAKITIGAAAAFMLAALLISAGVDRDRSVMEGTSVTPTPTPAAEASPGAEAAPAASPQADAAASPAADAAASPAASPAAAQPSPGQ
ncbi:MAG TPA: preprotein translocase subunit SecG [Pyrinomonadaceae bacterium]|nr:preprotein translocase subunit SecG [Pyrinomonadaceae bacterium]